MLKSVMALACAALFSLPAVAAPDLSAIRQAVDAAVAPVMAQYDVPGMAVAVTVDGQAMFFNYGVAARDSKRPVTEATLFELGSNSKTFTSTLGAYAQEQGQLSLHDHPSKFMPHLKGSALDKATLLHLATYTAGGFPLQVPDDVKTEAQLASYFQHWKPEAAPGQQRRYANPSIGLFGRITAVALGSAFTDAAERELFPQLGLQHTYIRVPATAMADYAWGYAKDQAVRVRPDLLDSEAYGVKSTAADMIHYVQTQIDPSGLAPAMQRAVQATHVGYFQVGPMTQGLGWESYPYPVSLERLLSGNSGDMAWESQPAQALNPPLAGTAPTLYNKTGSTRGFGSYVMFVPARKTGIVLLANRAYPNEARIRLAYHILQLLAPAAN
ncbi:class C beta-lactamase [Pseudoduganella ginsengisoli]|uniref:Class C beta-lactamase n=1 Tax=Pseudoduganella ginsengisoli TaxID=1462440 RepID=A0A6L6Q580_9BURK|nr:class C beta-lactamase [Pseudoduganella ginsengisoli]MTW04907.1 class C beta-lactamase [Pseudoduganella ginsengisoli]